MRLIDADAFKEYLKNAYEEVKHVYTDGGVFAWRITEDFCRDIDEQPTINAEPERKNGEWIVEKDCEGKTRTCICGLCGYKTDKYTWKNPNYCSNCGADMRGDSDE